jgi:hypothetical protein
MDTLPHISIIASIIFILAVIATGIWLARKNRYHIFYFSLCGLFFLSLVMFVSGVGTMMNSMVASQSGGDGIAYEEPKLFEGWGLFFFFRLATPGLFFLLAILSLINPFIGKNKLAVKIVSGVMIIVCALLLFLVYVLSHLGKVGG